MYIFIDKYILESGFFLGTPITVIVVLSFNKTYSKLLILFFNVYTIQLCKCAYSIMPKRYIRKIDMDHISFNSVIVYPSPTYMFSSFVHLRRFKHIHAQSVFSVRPVTAWLLLKIYINHQTSQEKLHFYISFKIYFTALKCNLPHYLQKIYMLKHLELHEAVQ